MDALYQLADCPNRGKILIASKDLLPGTEVLREERPLLFCSGAQINANPLQLIGAAFVVFKNQLTDQQQRRFLNLYGPTTGWQAEHLRSMAKSVPIVANQGSAPSLLSRADAEIFVKVACIARQASTSMQGGVGVYDLTSRVEHSCIPNCEAVRTDATGFLMVLRTIRPVKKGEKFTKATGLLRHRTEPTHVRRKKFLESKDFTCHCPRCDAAADDTREFDCFDATCPGSCFACQPLSNEPFTGNLPLQYTGVEYVEPHLLPCTVCHRAPPLKYQQDMFALEKRLPGLITMCGLEGIPESFIAMGEAGPSFVTPPPTGPQAGGSIESHIPRNHVLALDHKMRVFEYVDAHVHVSKRDFAKLEAAAREYARLVEHTSYYPSRASGERLWQIADRIVRSDQHTPTLLEIAKDCAEKSLRSHLITLGRECRYNDIDGTLVKVLQCMPSQPATTTECMFCGESPLRAALTLSRCGRCKQWRTAARAARKRTGPCTRRCARSKNLLNSTGASLLVGVTLSIKCMSDVTQCRTSNYCSPIVKRSD